MRMISLSVVLAIVFLQSVFCNESIAQEQKAATETKTTKISTPPPTKPPLESVVLSELPTTTEQIELFLLLGQSNMKGRGEMPDEPHHDSQIVMMHVRDDQWYQARHPLHLVGDAMTFENADNAGVGPGLAFAEAYRDAHPKSVVGLIPCAVGGSPISLWEKGAKLYDNAVRRAKLAIERAGSQPVRIRGALWLQGEANANAAGLEVHRQKLRDMIEDLRVDLGIDDLPFIACTIGEMGDSAKLADKAAMNKILLSLPSYSPNTACVDARDLTTHIGDFVHFDTAAQEEIGKRYFQSLQELDKSRFSWTSPLSESELAKPSLPASVRHATFKSPTMGIEVGYYIYLPPGYESGSQRYPVVFHLHGGRPGGETKSVKLASYVDAAVTAGKIPPTIYVFPNGGPFSWYDMPEMKHGMGESVFVKETIPHIDATYRTWGTREGRALEGYSQGGRGTTRIMFKHPELFLSVAPGGSGYATEQRIQQNEGFESETLRFMPLGYNTWDLAKAFADRQQRPELEMLIWDGSECFNYEANVAYSAYLKRLGIEHRLLIIDGVGHTATGSYDKNGDDIMLHHQRTFAKFSKSP